MAAWLTMLRVRKGERVLLLLENSPEYIAGYYGILKIGAVAVPLNIDIKPDTLRFIIDIIQPTAMLSSSRFEKRLFPILPGCAGLKGILLKKPRMGWSATSLEATSWDDILRNGRSGPTTVQVNDTDLASIIYTSGSTGQPKGVMLSHRNIIANTASIVQYLQLTSKDIQMVVLPFYYVMGKSLLNTHIAAGASLVINNRFAFTAAVLKEMAEEKITGFSGVPSTYAYLIHRSPLRLYKEKLPFLRYCSQAGGHLSRNLKRELVAMLPEHTRFIVMYGATEASARLSYLDSRYLENRLDSIGKPIPGVSMMIRGPKGQPLGDNEPGEIIGFGANIMMGYWKDDEATRQAFWRGGYRTGDIGYRDAEGFYYITGRKDDLVKISGHRVSIREVEEEMMETGMLLEAAVFATDDAYNGKRLCALAVPHDKSLGEMKFKKTLANRLPKFKFPSVIQLLNALPKFSNGKINRSACQKLLTNLPDNKHGVE